MKKHVSALIAMLLLLSGSWAGAEEVTVKVAGDRTAVFHMTDTEPPDPEFSGAIKGSIDLQGGKSALNADLKLKEAAELNGAKAGLFTQITADSIEAVGFLDATIPDEGDAPKVLDIKGETLTNGESSAGNFDMKVVAPSKGGKVPTGSGDVKFDGSFKAINSNGNFAFSRRGNQVKRDSVQEFYVRHH